MESFSDGGFANGLAVDGLPVVEPTRERVLEMLSGADPEESLGPVPPSLRRCDLWRVAACAVCAGCEPRAFEALVAATRAALAPAFNAHGAGATTMGCTPLVVLSGGAQMTAGVSGGGGCFGSGHRGNATLGRALKLVLHHVGGARLGGTECTTIGTPAKISACVGERASRGGWAPYTAAPAATVHPCTSATLVTDFDQTDPEDVMQSIGLALAHGCWGARFPLCSSALVLVSPEHETTLRKKYATREAFRDALFFETARISAPYLGGLIASKAGSLLGALAPYALSAAGALGMTPLPKFERPESIHVVVCGADAGKFSVVCGGFGAGKEGMPTYRLSAPSSAPVTALRRCAAAPRPLPKIVDPRHEAGAGPAWKLAPRTGAPLNGTVALLDISKGGGSDFLDGVEAYLCKMYDAVDVRRFVKPTFSRNAPDALVAEIAAVAAYVVIGVAD